MQELDRILTKRSYHLLTYIPLRTVAYHLVAAFLSSALTSLFLPYGLWLMGPDLRLRYKLHEHKTDPQARESFAAYGITELPFAAGGTLRFDGDAWLSERRRVEASTHGITKSGAMTNRLHADTCGSGRQ